MRFELFDLYTPMNIYTFAHGNNDDIFLCITFY